MGRAERRRLERSQRIEDRKGRVALRPDEIREIKRRTAHEISTFDVEVLLTCFAQVLRDQYQWGHKRIFRALTAVDETFGRVLRGELSVADMQQRLEDDAGIRIQCDER